MKYSLAATILAIASNQATAATIKMDSKQTNSNTTHPNLVWMENVASPHVDDVSQMCFSFNTNNYLPGFYYTLQGPWGSGTGHSDHTGTICVPTSNSAGGAMFIGLDENPGPGSTKLECYFPTTGQANCDMSLVDGYSSAVGCVPGNSNELIGGYTDLKTQGIACPDTQGENCLNKQGYAASQSDVDPFFQQGLKNNNNYCIWVNCSEDYYFPTGDGLICTVGGS